MINQQTPPNELARQIVEAAVPATDMPQPDVEADIPSPITARYSRRLSPMQQTALMASGTTPQEVATHGIKAAVPKRARTKDAKAKAKRKQAKVSRARNRR